MAARLSYLDRDQLTPELQEVYDTLRQASGRALNIYRLMAHHARSLPAFLRWYPTLREGALDLGLRYRCSRISSGWCYVMQKR